MEARRPPRPVDRLIRIVVTAAIPYINSQELLDPIETVDEAVARALYESFNTNINIEGQDMGTVLTDSINGAAGPDEGP